MSQKISERTLILLGDITGSEKMPLGVDGDKAITPDLLSQFFGSDFWPLGGAADLSAAFTLDGNNFDLTFGSPNQLDEFNVLATTGIHLHVDDGITHTHSLFDNNQILVDYDDGTVTMGLSISTDFQVNYNNGAGDSGGIFVGDSGGNALSQLFSNGLSQILADDGLGSTVHLNASAIGGNMLAEIAADDGVDTGSLNVTPVGHEFIGSFAHTEISPAQITANQNNYDPGPGVWFNLTSDASRNITGWVPQIADGDEFTAYNGGSFDIVFTHNDTGNSTAANCFSVPGGGSLTVSAGQSVTWKYSASQSRWRLISYTG